MPSCLYFIFIDASTSKHKDIFIVIGFSLEDKRGLRLGELIRPFCIMLLYQYLLHYGLLLHFISNTYGYSLLFYKVYHEEGECRQLEFWLEKEQTLETYSALLQKCWDSMKPVFGFIKNLWAKEIGQGPTPCPGDSPPPLVGRGPLSPGPPGGLRRPSSAISSLLPWKNHGQAYGTKLRCHEAEPI